MDKYRGLRIEAAFKAPLRKHCRKGLNNIPSPGCPAYIGMIDRLIEIADMTIAEARAEMERLHLTPKKNSKRAA